MKGMPWNTTIYLMKILSLSVPLENNNNNSNNNSKPPCDNEASPGPMQIVTCGFEFNMMQTCFKLSRTFFRVYWFFVSFPLTFKYEWSLREAGSSYTLLLLHCSPSSSGEIGEAVDIAAGVGVCSIANNQFTVQVHKAAILPCELKCVKTKPSGTLGARVIFHCGIHNAATKIKHIISTFKLADQNNLIMH